MFSVYIIQQDSTIQKRIVPDYPPAGDIAAALGEKPTKRTANYLGRSLDFFVGEETQNTSREVNHAATTLCGTTVFGRVIVVFKSTTMEDK